MSKVDDIGIVLGGTAVDEGEVEDVAVEDGATTTGDSSLEVVLFLLRGSAGFKLDRGSGTETSGLGGEFVDCCCCCCFDFDAGTGSLTSAVESAAPR